MKGVSQTLKQRAVYVSSDCTAKKKSRGQHKIKFWGASLQAHPGVYSLWLEDQHWLFNLCGCSPNPLTVWLMAPGAVAFVPVSLDMCSVWTVFCLSACRQVLSDCCHSVDHSESVQNQSAGAVCKCLPLGSFLYLDTNFVYQLLKMDFVTDLHQ